MRARPGFTLIEVVVVILILTVLAALLMPALTGAQRSARRAKAVAEITQLASALELFKSTYGIYPPSFIVLKENAEYDTSNADDAHSVRMLRRMWPNISINVNGSGSHTWNINRDGDTDDTISLNGGECLVFFLGGVLGAQFSPSQSHLCRGIGFSKNPTNPFETSTSSSRHGPFFEFVGARLMDAEYDESAGSNEGMPEYEDVFAGGVPLAYFSAYEGQGYLPGNFTWTGATAWDYKIGSLAPVTYVGPNPYVMNTGSTGAVGSNPANAAAFWKERTYQIICAGEDGLFGGGGCYNPNEAKGVGLADPADWDNLTNFVEGTLGGS